MGLCLEMQSIYALISLQRKAVGILRMNTNSSEVLYMTCVFVHDCVHGDVWEYDREREREQVQKHGGR